MTYLFLDESGDLGFNPKKKNSKYFVITVLFASDKKLLESVVKKIHKNLRKKVKRLSGGVLHAVKEKPVTRKRLLKLLADKEISIMTIYLNKANVYTKLQDEKHVLYNYVTNILLDRIMTKHLGGNKEITVIASKRETNKFLNDNFKNYLENQVANKHKKIITIEIKRPSEEKALQAVDFACWAIFRKYEIGDEEYYSLIKKKIIEESPLYAKP
jgi:flagellar biosynthesis component FlhA